MNRRFHINQDVVAGLMFMAFGAFFLWFGRRYPLGTALRMGPGYMPMLLGSLLVAIGLIVAGKGALTVGEKLEGWALRPLFLICGAFLLFAWIIEDAGLIVAGILAMVCAAAGSSEFRVREQLILATVAAGASAALFVYGLGLPMKYLPLFRV
jgi:putative tricarboxylic transport membrane protein